MWTQVKKPEKIEKRTFFVFDNRKSLDFFQKFKCPVIIGCPKGLSCITVVTPLKKKTPIPNRPCPPKGSEVSESSDTDDLDYTWQDVQDTLDAMKWKKPYIYWWKSSQNPVGLPTLTKKSRLVFPSSVDVDTILLRNGFNNVTIGAHATPWAECSPIVRRFWRAMLAYLCKLPNRVRLTLSDLSAMSAYARDYLPPSMGWYMRPHITTPNSRISAPQYAVVARMIEYVADFKKRGLEEVWPNRERYQAEDCARRAAKYMKLRYSFIPCDKNLTAQCTFLDIMCEYLWFNQWDEECHAEYDEPSFWRAFGDTLEECEEVTMLERYCPKIPDEMFYGVKDGNGGLSKLDCRLLINELQYLGFEWSHIDHKRKKSNRLFMFGSNKPPIYAISRHVPYKKWLFEEHIIDPNWIEMAPACLPQRLLDLETPLPMVPCFSDQLIDLTEVILGAIQQDQFYLRLPRWFKSAPIFHYGDTGKLYFNSSFYGFSREVVFQNLVQALELPTETIPPPLAPCPFEFLKK
jgi:hypothetical protein